MKKKFKNEKYRLAADRVKKRYLTAKEDEADTIGTSVTITSKAQYEQAMQLRDELTQLRKKIVGNSHDRKPIIVTAGSLPQRGPELDRRVASGEIPEIQIFEPGHVYSRLQQGDQEYWFDSASYGLTTDKRPKKFTTASLFSSDDTVLKLKAFVS